MNTSIHDVVVVGAGHNSLVAAAYLAKAGLRVLILERNSMIGGGAVSREVTLPGFIHDTHATGIAHLQTHPILTHDELGILESGAVQFAFPEVSYMTIFGDGDAIACYNDLDRTCAEIARYSPSDATAYRRMADFMAQVSPLISMSMNRPPSAFGAFVQFIESTPFGNELLLALMKSTYDIVVENFTHPKVRMHFLKWAAEAAVAPEEKTTGLNMFFLIGASHSRPPGAVIGGTARLTQAIASVVLANGGEIRTNAEVQRVINRNGVARAVELVDGTVIEARRAVVASIHPHHLGEMVPGLDAGLVARARKTQTSSYAELTVHAAVRHKIEWKVGSQPDNALAINLVETAEMTDFRRIFDSLKYGELPRSFIGCVSLHTNYDHSRAPAGQHTLYLNVFVPYQLTNESLGGWDAYKAQHGKWAIDQVCTFTRNLTPESFAAIHVESPMDMERHSPSFRHGDIMGLGSYSYQSLGMRPTAELAQYRVPGAEGLYLSGPCMHPGGGITGGGRAVAIRILEDLGQESARVLKV